MKQNLIARSAVAAAFGLVGASAMAGTLAVNTASNYAKQAFVGAASTIAPATAFTYQTSSLVAAGSTTYLYFYPSTGTSFDNTVSNASLKANTTASTGFTIADTAVTANGVVVVTLTANATTGAPIGSTVSVNVPNIATFKVNGATAVLGVNGTGSLALNAELANTNAAVAPASFFENATAVLATSSNAVTLSTAASAAVSQINVAQTNQLVSGNQVVLGSISFAGVSGQHVNLSGNQVTAGSAANGATTFNTYNALNASFNIGGAFANGSSIFVSNQANCATSGLVAGSAQAIANTSTTSVAVSYTLNSADANSYTGANDTFTQYICYNVAPAAVGNNAIPVSNFNVSSVAVANSTGLAAVSFAGGNLASLGYNGATVNLSSYLPGSFAPTFTGYVRVVNTGSVTTNVTGTLYDITGAVIASNMLVASNLAPNGSATIDTPTLEKNNNVTTTAKQWYRLVLTGTTSGLQARSMVVTPQGTLVDATATASGAGSNQ